MSTTEIKRRYCEYLERFGARDSDIWVATFSKSGTTWMQMILYQLTTAGDMSFDHLFDVSPWVYYAALRKVEPKTTPDPRILKTHDGYEFMAANSRGRTIYVLRDGKDVAVSWYHHRCNFRGFEGTFDAHFDEFLHDDDYNWFDHVRQWLSNPRGRPVLYVKYEDLQVDFQAAVDRIVGFCDLSPQADVLERVRERCAFTHMKKHENQLAPRASHFDNDPAAPYKIKSAPFLRTAKIGEWSEVLNKEQLLAYRKKFDEVLGDLEIVADYR